MHSRWPHEEIFHVNREDIVTIHNNIETFIILKSLVKSVLAKLKRNKAKVKDAILVEQP